MTTNSRLPIYSTVTRMSAAKRAAVRKSFATPKLETASYEIRARRKEVESTEDNILDDVYLADLNEIVLDDLTYPNTALVGVKIRLTDQLSNIPKVTYINSGRVIKEYGRPLEGAISDEWYDAASKNPAWILWDMLTNSRFGGGLPSSRLDLVAFKTWADHCVAEGLEWNGVIEDSGTNIWDVSQYVLRAGRAQIVNVGTRYTIVIEKAAVPVMMFSVANMVEGSYKETWLGTADRANEIDVTFFDKEDNYKQRTVKVYDSAAVLAGSKQRSSAITLRGVTNYDIAYREAILQLNLNRYVLRTVSFSAPLEAVACSVGDLVYVQHDMTEWALAGRFEAGSTTSVANLDREITMVEGKQYKLLVTHDAIERHSGTVLAVIGTSIFLSGFPNSLPVKRIQINGRDLRVAGTFGENGANTGVVLDDQTGISPGATYSLWDTDVIEEYSVVNDPGTHVAVTVQSPMAFSPQQYANWMFGESDKVKNRFRVKSVTGSHDYLRDIVAIEYADEIYDINGPDVPFIDPENGIIGPVLALEVYEETYVTGSSIVTQVIASWNPPITGLYSGAKIYAKVNDEEELVIIGEAKNSTRFVVPAEKGDILTVKVVSYDLFGKFSPYDLAPEKTITVKGDVGVIDVGDVTGADLTWAGRDCKITWRYNATTGSYEFGSELSGGDAGALDPQFKDYEIRVFDSTGTVRRRTEYTANNSYTYTYEKNFDDGLTRALTFELRMRDIFNNLGAPTVLTARNPPPRIVTADNTSTFESATIAYTHSNDADFAGVIVWLSRQEESLVTAPGALPADTYAVYKGPDSAILLPKLVFDTDYYYRIAAYDAFGTSELLPTAILHFRTTFLDVDAIADGVLDDSKLVPILKEQIDLIDADASVPGSVNARLLELESQSNDSINAAILDAQTKITALEEQTAELVTKANTTADEKITALEVLTNTLVVDLGAASLAKIDQLETTVNGLLSGASLSTKAQVTVLDDKFTSANQATEAKITAINDVKATSTSASARQLAVLDAVVTNPATGLAKAQALITALNTVDVTSTSAAASQLAGLKAVVNHPTTGLSAAKASIDQLNNVSVTSTSATASQLATLKAAVNNPTTGLPAAFSSITALNDISATSTSASAKQLSALQATVNNPVTGLAKAQALITALNDVSTTSTSAAASQLASLKAVVNHPTTGLAKAKASIDELNNVSATSTSAAASQLAALKVQVNSPTTGLPAAQASITALNDISATSTSASAQQLNSLKVQVNSPTTGLAAAKASIDALNNISATSTSASASQLAALKASVNDPVTGLAKAQASITALNNVSTTSTSATASQLATLKASVNDPVSGLAKAKASIDQLNNVTTTSTSAAASQLATLKAAVNDPATGLAKAQASITALNNVATTSTSAAAQQLATLKATVAHPVTGLTAAQAAITALNTVTTTSASATASQLATLKASVNHPTTGLPAALASIVALNNVATTSTSATASQLATVKVQVNHPTTGLAASAAQIIALNNVATTSTSAAASQLAGLKATVNHPTTGLAAAQASIVQLNNVSATSGSASARAITQVASRLNNVGGVTIEQAFITQANSMGTLTGQYSVKVDLNGYVTGFGLMTTSKNAVPTSEFIINADKFALILPGAPKEIPFVIGTVNGQVRTVIKAAIIGDATIKTAMIGNLEVSTLKIAGQAVTQPMSFSASPNVIVSPSAPVLRGYSSWVQLDTGFVTAITVAKISAGYTNCRLQARIQLQGGGHQVIFDTSTTTSRDTITTSAAGTLAVPHAGLWRIEMWVGNDWTGGSFRLENFTCMTFASKK